MALLWNSVGSLLAFYLLQLRYPLFASQIGALDYILAAFAGVFILEFVLANTNVIVFNRGFFAFQNWMNLVRDPALVSATNKQAVLKGILQDKLKEEIKVLPSEELQADLLKHLGSEELQKLEQDAKDNGVEDLELYKVLRLVELHPAQATVLSNRAKRYRKQRQGRRKTPRRPQ